MKSEGPFYQNGKESITFHLLGKGSVILKIEKYANIPQMMHSSPNF